MANQKSHMRKDRIPSFTYIKEFNDFNIGYNDMITMVPDITNYCGDITEFDSTSLLYSRVIDSLLNTISENIPSPNNPNFPNTMALSISSKEVGFLTDDQMAFGWKIFLQKNSDDLIYQFRITFFAMSVAKKRYIEDLLKDGWKEKDLYGKQSRFWNEIHINDRPSYKDGPAPQPKQQPVQPNRKSERSKDVQEVLPKNGEDELVEITFPGTNQKVWIKKEDLAKSGIYNKPTTMPESAESKLTVDPTLKETVEPEQPVIAPKPHNVVLEHTESKQPVQQATPKQVVKMTDTSGNIQASRDISTCAIYPYEGQATFRIVHFGNEFIYNINDRQDGIFVDRNSRTIKIDNVLYNYSSFTVNQLNEDYEAESSTYVPALEDKMREHGPVDDSIFVPRSVVEKVNNPDLSYSETVIANKWKQDMQARINGMNPPPQKFNTMKMPPQMTGNGKPVLVIDRNKQPAAAEPNPGGVAQQVVRMTNTMSH